jgi:glycosyltransferase involved in cell wall biosynthesis
MTENTSTHGIEAIEAPLVSVIMNCFNSDQYLREAIESILAQSYQNWELIFWDNQSTDQSPAIFHGFTDQRLKYYRAHKKTPLYEARRYALEKTTGALIAFLDCDDRWIPSKLTTQVELLSICKDIDLVYSNYYIINWRGDRTSQYFKRVQPSGNVFRSFLGFYPVNIQTVMFRKTALDHMAELFDPSMYYVGDYDFFIRLLYNRKAEYQHTPLAEYRIHSGQCSLSLIERGPQEHEMVLAKLEKMVPNFDVTFRDEAILYRAKNAYLWANAAMSKGRAAEAKKILQPFRSYRIDFSILYCLAMLPAPCWNLVNKYRKIFGF